MTATDFDSPAGSSAPTGDAPAGISRAEMAVAGLVVAWLVVASPQFVTLYWAPKVAIALIAVGPGLVALGLAARGGDGAARAGIAFLVIAALATALSPSPLLSLVGPYNDGNGLLFLAVVLGAWALGRRSTARGRDVLVGAILVAAVVNTVMVWLQMSSAFSGDLFERVDGRGVGLLGNPVHTTGFLVGAAALAAELWPTAADAHVATGRLDARSRAWLVLMAIAGFASAVQLAGGRIGLVLLVLVAVRTVVRVGPRRAGAVVAMLVLGVVIATVALPTDTGAADRLATSGQSSLGGRVDRWRLAVPAVAERPVLGIGPGLYRRATSPHNTPAAARAYGADSLNQDAHNLFVQTLVTTGILGLVALLAWLVLAAVGARGPLLWFAIIGGASLLVQPPFIGVTPVLALALGAAASRPARPFGRAALTIAISVAVVGALVGGLLLRGDHLVQIAGAEFDVTAAREAPRALPVWAEPYLVLSRVESYEAITTRRPARWKSAIAAARAAVRRDPSDPGSWIVYGSLELNHGSRRRAEAAFREARRWNPYSTAALGLLAGLAESRGDHARAAALCATARAGRPPRAKLVCPTGLRTR